MHENREPGSPSRPGFGRDGVGETSRASAQAGRSGKANNHNPDMNSREESDCAIVPMKLPNKEASASEEAAEGRAQTRKPGTGHSFPAQFAQPLVKGKRESNPMIDECRLPWLSRPSLGREFG